MPVTPAQYDAAIATIQREAAALPVTLEQLPADSRLKDVYHSDAYIVFEVGDVRLAHRVVKGKVPGLFDFQRNALATLIGQPEKGDWKSCTVSRTRTAGHALCILDCLMLYSPAMRSHTTVLCAVRAQMIVEEETELVDAIKERFKPFDFSEAGPA